MDAVPDNAAHQLAHHLTVQILRGSPPPGTSLPTVRALAAAHGVNPATVQRALARLEATGLVDVRHGSGIRVRDAHDQADLSLLPAWLEALADRPDEAASLVADFLELRRVLVVGLLARHEDRVAQHVPALVQAAAALREAASQGRAALQRADLALTQTVLDAAGNRAGQALFVTLRRLLERVPHLADAMYATPSDHVAALDRLAACLAEGPAALREGVAQELATADTRTVARYRAALDTP